MDGVPDMRRRSPEPPAGPPEIQLKPGMANELLHELAPLLAEEGIDVGNIDVADPDTLQQALNRAIERHNMAMFTPVGQARDLAAVTLRLAAEAIADGDTRLAAAILDQAQPESRDGSAATVSGCIGVALGLLDQWLTGHDADAPAGLARLTRLPAGHWTGEHAATDILILARKGRAFASLDALIARQGGQHVLYGSALALAAALQAWSRHAGTPSSTWRVPSFVKTDTIPAISGQCCDDGWNPPRHGGAKWSRRSHCRAARPGIGFAGTLFRGPGLLPRGWPGKGRAHLPSWKGLLHASAAVYRIRGSRGPHLGRRSCSARGAGADPDRCAGGQCEPGRLEAAGRGHVRWPAPGRHGVSRIRRRRRGGRGR